MILGGAKDINSLYLIGMVRKTYRRRKQTKRKTSRRRKTIRHRKGGRNARQNNEFDDRRADLINTLQDIIDRAEQAQGQPNANEMTFVDEIRAFEDEADEIDNYFGNNDMEEMLNQRIGDIMIIFGLANPNGNVNNNNNETITLPNYNRNNNNKMNLN
jgi:hypothetical protein